MDSPEWASEAILALEGAAQEAFGEAGKAMEDGVPAGGPFDADKVARKAPSEIAVGSSFLARLANAALALIGWCSARMFHCRSVAVLCWIWWLLV